MGNGATLRCQCSRPSSTPQTKLDSGFRCSARQDWVAAAPPGASPGVADRSRLPPHTPCVLVFTERDETHVPQMVVWRPFDELKIGYQYRPQPAALLHLVGRESVTPASAVSLGQIRKRAYGALQPASGSSSGQSYIEGVEKHHECHDPSTLDAELYHRQQCRNDYHLRSRFS
jgi:hypothetical protein